MICPFCSSKRDKVIDSRPTEGGQAVRRRRECLACGKRYSTYERVEQSARLMVVKKDGTRVPFDIERVLKGITAAVGKRPVSADQKHRIANEVEEELHLEYEREVPSTIIGERVMARLRETDLVSYIRFAVEHKQWDTLDDIARELRELEARPPAGRDQQDLFRGEAPAPAPAG